MARNQLCKQYQTLQKAVDDALESTESVEKDIVIISLHQHNSYATDVEEDYENVLQKL